MANRHKAPRLKNPEVQKLMDAGMSERSAYLAMMAKDVEHHKYKRCLDNAWWCRKFRNVYALIAYTHRGWKIAGYYDDKAELYRKWSNRWMNLAKKFKDKEEK